MKMFLSFLLLLTSTLSFAKGTIYSCDFSEDLGGITFEGQLQVVTLPNLKDFTTSYYADYWVMDSNDSIHTENVISYSFEKNSTELSELLANENFAAFLSYVNVDAATLVSARLFEVEPSDDGSAFVYYSLKTATEAKTFVQIGWGLVLECK